MADSDDLTARIGEILNSPEQMQRIQSLASMLGLGQNPQPSPPPSPETGFDPAVLSAITTMLSRMGELNQNDPGIALLQALRPLLGERRRQRVDEAAKMLKLARMLPLLKDTGILNLDF